jgi:cell division protein FtsW (lipid II flippase)
MKPILNSTKFFLNKATMLMAGLLLSLLAVAQDKKVDVNINTKSDSDSSSFFTQPWVWIVGGAVFLLLLVALLRNNNSRN